MLFAEEKWEYSGEEPEEVERKTLTVGEHNLFIKDAELKNDNNNPIYILTLSDLADPEAESTFRYWLNTTDSNNKIIKNVQARGTLITLGEALAGTRIGIPSPRSIIGGVVRADVKMSKPNSQGQSYLRIYKFDPVEEEYAMCAAISQYYIGAEID
jgi:hypothetical protein